MRGGFYGRFPARGSYGPRPLFAPRGPSPGYAPPPMMCRPPPFDQYLCEEYFPRHPEGDDTAISQVSSYQKRQTTSVREFGSGN